MSVRYMHIRAAKFIYTILQLYMVTVNIHSIRPRSRHIAAGSKTSITDSNMIDSYVIDKSNTVDINKLYENSVGFRQLRWTKLKSFHCR